MRKMCLDIDEKRSIRTENDEDRVRRPTLVVGGETFGGSLHCLYPLCLS